MAELQEQDNFKPIVVIQIARIYDVLCLLCSKLGAEEEINKLRQLHEKGMLFEPPPAMEIDDDQPTNDQ